jgi:predicted ATPase/DNA-binding CsgD family transcriptional regulator
MPAPTAPDLPRHNLPAPLTRFLGRQDETREVSQAIGAHRMTTITGVGGSGKTRLALHVAGHLLGAADDGAPFRDGVWLVELAAITRDDDVARAVAHVFGLREEAGREPIDTVLQELRPSELLLVLDNCEHVLDGCASVATRVLTAAPGVRVLTTSREPLGVEGEWTWRVPSLDPETARTLFVDRSRLVRPNFEPDDTDDAAITELVQQLDGLPLAIELAAARSRVMQPARILESLTDRFRLLTGGSRQKLARQQTLEASVAWSYELLSEPEQQLTQRLAVMRDFDLDAAQAVGGTGEPAPIVDLLTRLVDKSLLAADHAGRDTRYRFLETVRQFLLTRLQHSGEMHEVRQRHLHHFLALAERFAPHLASREGPTYLAELQVNRHSLDSALEWAEATQASDMMLRLVTALSLFYELGGHLAPGGRWFARALALPESNPSAATDSPETSLRACALWGAAHVAFYGGHYEPAAAYAEAALDLATACGDRWAEGRALNTLGAAHSLSDPVGSRKLLARSVALGRESGDDWAVGDGIKMTTVAWYAQHDDDRVRATLEELQAVGERLGSRFFLAWQQAMVGYFARDRGELDAAAVALASAEAHSCYVGDPSTGGFVECWSAGLDMDLGRFESARLRLEHFLATAAAAGSELAIPEGLYAMGQWFLAHGDAAAAKALVAEHIDTMFAYGLPTFGGLLLLVTSEAERRSGDMPSATRALDRASEHTAYLENPFLDALLQAERGRIALADGSHAKAEQHLHGALATQVRIGAVPSAVRTLETLAAIAALAESFAESVRVLSAVDRFRQQMGLARGPVETSEHAALRHVLGERLAEAFDVEWDAAQSVPFADCVAYVTRMRGQRKRPSMGWESLTPTELRVAALVAEGLTNPQIGTRLFISRGTAKVHLAHIFAKLGLTSRAQLAVMAAEREPRPA